MIIDKYDAQQSDLDKKTISNDLKAHKNLNDWNNSEKLNKYIFLDYQSKFENEN
jgi:hypothetical protein